MVSLSNQEQHSLDYGFSPWRISSQAASNLYNHGVKLWTKEDLRDIEQQLEHSATHQHFKVRSIDGGTILIKNPMFGEQAPIW